MSAVNALSAYSDPSVSEMLLNGWRAHSPALRKRITEILLGREQSTIALLRAAEAGDASVAGIEMSRRGLLLKHDNATIRSLAERLFGAESAGERAEVIAAYKSALSLSGDLTRGEQIFRRDCMACHKIGKIGYALGPDLTSSASRDAQALLVHVLDPNRYVLPNYEQYICVDVGGRVVTGIITSQTATSVTLKRDENKTETILRGQIEQLASSGKSLMPEGMEKILTKQDMADLIAWLQSAQQVKPTGNQPLHIGTLPGLIEPEE